MLDIRPATANDQIIAFNSSSVVEVNNSYRLEPDKGITNQLRYGNWLGITHQDFSSEEGIQEHEPSEQFLFMARQEPRREINPSKWKIQSPTTDEGLAPLTKNPALEFQWRQILQRFEVISRREDNWDERETKKPSELALNHAKIFMEEFFDAVIAKGHSWLTPFISSDEDGYITVAWHKGEHELHLEIAEYEVEYTTVWGIRIDTEMDIGILKSDNYLTLWEWLLDG